MGILWMILLAVLTISVSDLSRIISFCLDVINKLECLHAQTFKKAHNHPVITSSKELTVGIRAKHFLPRWQT
jgi:hypothetical protein